MPTDINIDNMYAFLAFGLLFLWYTRKQDKGHESRNDSLREDLRAEIRREVRESREVSLQGVARADAAYTEANHVNMKIKELGQQNLETGRRLDDYIRQSAEENRLIREKLDLHQSANAAQIANLQWKLNELLRVMRNPSVDLD